MALLCVTWKRGEVLKPGLHAATWDGLDDSGNPVKDGHYAVVILFTDLCGNQSRQDVFVEVDRTPPDVAIHYPRPGDPLTTLVEIQGRVRDAHLDDVSRRAYQAMGRWRNGRLTKRGSPG